MAPLLTKYQVFDSWSMRLLLKPNQRSISLGLGCGLHQLDFLANVSLVTIYSIVSYIILNIRMCGGVMWEKAKDEAPLSPG